MEKMLITKALDERDFLAKKINEKINKTTFSATIRNKDKKINGVDVAEFEENAKSEYQSIMDMIDRYNRINSAITLSNATIKITFSDGTEMTKAEAIAKKKIFNQRDNFEKAIIDRLSYNFANMTNSYDKLTREVDRMSDDYKQSMLNSIADKNKKLDEDQVKAIDTMIEPYEPNIIDPIHIQEKIEKLVTKRDAFISEVDTLLKISNATEFVEF